MSSVIFRYLVGAYAYCFSATNEIRLILDDPMPIGWRCSGTTLYNPLQKFLFCIYVGGLRELDRCCITLTIWLASLGKG
jgi:hypothetical protein